MSSEKEFGSTLQKLRLAKNLSQLELAQLSGLDRTFISLLERGRSQPSLATLFSLGKALEMKPHELVREVENSVRRRRWGLLKK